MLRTARPAERAIPWVRSDLALAVGLGLLALAVRSYLVAGTPIWLDEVVSVWIVRQGPAAIVANSLVDPHPPGWYMLFWLTTGFGTPHSEWGARWISVLAGAATVAIVTFVARRHAGPLATACAGLALAASPLHIYFSQEARPPVMLALAAAAAVLALEQVIARPDDRRALAALVLIGLGGMYLGYFFVLVTGVQALALIVMRRWRAALVYCLTLAFLGAPLVYLFLKGVAHSARTHVDKVPDLLGFAQALVGGEPVRFGFGWWHPVLLALVGGVALLALPALRSSAALRYHAAQVLLPLAGFWILLVGLLGFGLPLHEAKQFMVLLPSLFVLVAAGLDQLARWLPRPLGAVALGAFAVAAGAVGLSSAGYAWSIGKSPEGDAARALIAAVAPGDAIIALNYSPSYVLGYYRPDLRQYGLPAEGPNGWDLAVIPPATLRPPPDLPRVPLASLLVAPRVWVVSYLPRPEPIVDAIRQRCASATPSLYGPFELLRLEGCSP